MFFFSVPTIDEYKKRLAKAENERLAEEKKKADEAAVATEAEKKKREEREKRVAAAEEEIRRSQVELDDARVQIQKYQELEAAAMEKIRLALEAAQLGLV